MGSAVTKTEVFKQMEADVAVLKLGAENLQKIQSTISGIQDKATTSLKSFGDIKDKVTGKLEESTKKITDVTNIQNDIQGKMGKYEGALKKAASSALTGGLGGIGKTAMGGMGGFF